jgi:hypothetical protein
MPASPFYSRVPGDVHCEAGRSSSKVGREDECQFKPAPLLDYMPVIPATQEMEVRGPRFEPLIKKQSKKQKSWGCGSSDRVLT